MKFSIGDIVQLKSGGPLLTVGAVEDKARIHCVYYSEDVGEFRSHDFPAGVLVHVDIEDAEDEDDED